MPLVDKLLLTLGLSSCAGCGKPGAHSLLCADCLADITPVTQSCDLCGDHPLISTRCLHCAIHPPPWTSCVCPISYTSLPRNWLHSAKFQEDLVRLRLLRELARAQPLGAAAGIPDAVVPVPMPDARLRERGVHVPMELACAISRFSGAPMLSALLSKEGRLQHGASRRERLTLPATRFACVRPVAGRSILLVDDVMTTGATLRSATRCLLRAGAKRVDVFALMRTPALGSAPDDAQAAGNSPHAANGPSSARPMNTTIPK